MQQLEDSLQYVVKHPPGIQHTLGIQHGLGELDVPVTEGVPGELVEGIRSIVIAVFIKGGPSIPDGLVQLGQDPLFSKPEFCRVKGYTFRFKALYIAQNKFTCVPDLVDEEAISLYTLITNAH